MANFATYRHKSYDGGLNNTSSWREIDRDQASYLENWDITYKGRLTSRKGLTKIGGNMTAVKALGLYKQQGGTNYLLAVDNTDVRYLNGSTWTDIGNITSSVPMSFANVLVENKIYMSADANGLWSWGGSGSIAQVSSVPAGNKIIWYQNHMIHINNVDVGGTKYPNRAYISNFGDPETYTTASDFIELPGEGKGITAEVLGNALVIFKEDSFLFLTGYGIASWVVSGTVTGITYSDSSVGTLSVRGVVKPSANELWFVDNQGYIRRIRQTDAGYESEVMSENMEDSRSDLDLSKLSNAVAWYDDNKIYFALTKTGATNNNIVWVYDRTASKRNGGKEAWTTYTGWVITDMISFSTNQSPTLYLSNTTNVFSHTGYDDNDVAIVCRWDSKNDDYDKPEKYKKYAYGYIYATAQAAGSVDIYAGVGGKTFSKLDTITLASSGTPLGPTGDAAMGPTGEFILGGATDVEEKYYFADGGGEITGKTVAMSLRASTSSIVSIESFTNHFTIRSLK